MMTSRVSKLIGSLPAIFMLKTASAVKQSVISSMSLES